MRNRPELMAADFLRICSAALFQSTDPAAAAEAATVDLTIWLIPSLVPLLHPQLFPPLLPPQTAQAIAHLIHFDQTLSQIEAINHQLPSILNQLN